MRPFCNVKLKLFDFLGVRDLSNDNKKQTFSDAIFVPIASFDCKSCFFNSNYQKRKEGMIIKQSKRNLKSIQGFYNLKNILKPTCNDTILHMGRNPSYYIYIIHFLTKICDSNHSQMPGAPAAAGYLCTKLLYFTYLSQGRYPIPCLQRIACCNMDDCTTTPVQQLPSWSVLFRANH